MKTPITYYGGKQKIGKKIVDLFPANYMKLPYCEPFCGVASVFFLKKYKFGIIETINDYNKNVVNFFRVLRDENKYKEFLRLLKYPVWARDFHREAVEHCKQEFELTDEGCPRRAYYYFYNITTSFGSIENTNFGYAKKENTRDIVALKNKRGRLLERNLDGVLKYVERMRGVQIENIDAIECIKKYDTPNTLFYVDPPYIDTSQRYKHKYTKEQYDDLLEVLNNIEGSFLLSSYNNEQADSYGWEQFKIKARCYVATINTKDAIRTEIIYRKLNKQHQTEI